MTPAELLTRINDLLPRVTPGPWKFFSWGKYAGAQADDCDVAHCHGFSDLRSFDEVKANAALVALTPDLARLCQAQAREIADLKAALRFYGDEENWQTDEADWDTAEQIGDDASDDELAALNIISAVEADGGKIARSALATPAAVTTPTEYVGEGAPNYKDVATVLASAIANVSEVLIEKLGDDDFLSAQEDAALRLCRAYAEGGWRALVKRAEGGV